MRLIDAGCPVERHELTNDEWLALGELKHERAAIMQEEYEKNRKR